MMELLVRGQLALTTATIEVSAGHKRCWLYGQIWYTLLLGIPTRQWAVSAM